MILFYCLLVTVILIGFATLILGTGQDIRRPHLPARTPHHKPGHALGGPPATAPPAPGVVYRANARSELVRQRAAQVFAHEFGTDRRPGGAR